MAWRLRPYGIVSFPRSFVNSLRPPNKASVTPSDFEPIAAPAPVGAVLEDVVRLNSGGELFRVRDISVFLAEAREMPVLLYEIARQREIAFRAVGEGSGQALDRDRFDRTYLHLVAWDHREQQLVGAYRIGPTDRLIAESGADGLYCSSLFLFDCKTQVYAVQHLLNNDQDATIS